MKSMITGGRTPWRPRAALLAGLLAGSLSATPAPAGDGPFAGLQGLWGGTGTVTYASGTKERLRCRVQYTQNSPDNLQQALLCASDSYRFQINAYFQHSGGFLSGRWDELGMDISGTITGKATSGHIDGALHGPGFLASVKVDTRGDRQTVVIAAADQEIRNVSVEVHKTSQ